MSIALLPFIYNVDIENKTFLSRLPPKGFLLARRPVHDHKDFPL